MKTEFRMKRIHNGYETACGRFAVFYGQRRGAGWCWIACEYHAEGGVPRKVECVTQKEARAVVQGWVAERDAATP